MDCDVHSTGYKLEGFERAITAQGQLVVEKSSKVVKVGSVDVSRRELVSREGYCTNLVNRGGEGEGSLTAEGCKAFGDEDWEASREKRGIIESFGDFASGKKLALGGREKLRLRWGSVHYWGSTGPRSHIGKRGAGLSLTLICRGVGGGSSRLMPGMGLCRLGIPWRV